VPNQHYYSNDVNFLSICLLDLKQTQQIIKLTKLKFKNRLLNCIIYQRYKRFVRLNKKEGPKKKKKKAGKKNGM
jgi:hypothetical protein